MTQPRLRAVAYGTPALDALADTISAAKAGDPLAPVTVVPPHVSAGLSLRRALARRGGVVNTRFMPLARLAELVGAPSLSGAGRTPLTSALRREAVRIALAEAPGAFADVATSAATVDALDSAFGELRPLEAEALDEVATTTASGAEAVRLFRLWRTHTSSFYDDVDVLEAAAGAVVAGAPALRDVGSVILHLPAALPPAALSLLDALAAAGNLWMILGLTADEEADATVAALADRFTPGLGAAVIEAPSSLPAPTRLVVAPTPEEEVRVAARNLLRHVRDDVPLHRVAFVSHALSPYALIAGDVLTEAGIPCHGPSSHTLAQTVSGRVLLGALALPERGFARHEVMAWIHSGPLVDGGGRRVTAADWDRRSRQAGVTAGSGQWQRRLDGFAARIEGRRADAERQGDLTRATRLQQAITETRSLADFVDGLTRRLEVPGDRRWSSWAQWAHHVLTYALGGEAVHGEWPEHEIEALRAIEDALDQLAALDILGTTPDGPGFRQALEDELAVPAPRTTQFGDGVFVGRVADLVGADVDVVYVLGVTEGSFPARPSWTLLHESDDDSSAATAGPEARRREQRRIWLAAQASAGERILLTSSGDPRAGRPLHPAPWFLEAATRRAGEPVFAETLAPWAGAEWLELVRSAEAGLRQAPDPASPAERDLIELVGALEEDADPGDHPLAQEIPSLGRAFRSIAARSGASPGPWGGLVGSLDDHFAGRVFSPTSLEQWASCPFRYFLSHVLDVDVLDDPEDIETLAASDRGLLVHEILDAFIRGATGVTPSTGWDEGAHGRLDDIIDERFAEWEAKGRTGHLVLWEAEQQRLRRLLHRVLDVDGEARARLGVAPVATEFAFTDDAEGVLEIPLEGGRSVRLRGSIDRVDLAPDGSALRVTDYKTGTPISESLGGDPFVSDRFRAGTKLQLAVYALAARRKFGDVPTRADYWYLSERWRFKVEGYEVTEGVVDDFRSLLGRIVEGIEGGVFPANPGEETYHPAHGDTHSHCIHCPYDRVCPSDRADAWARLEDDGVAATYGALAEGGDS